MSYPVGTEVIVADSEHCDCPQNATVEIPGNERGLALVRIHDYKRFGWTGAKTHNIPPGLIGVKGLWWVSEKDLSIADHDYPGYDLD